MDRKPSFSKLTGIGLGLLAAALGQPILVGQAHLGLETAVCTVDAEFEDFVPNSGHVSFGTGGGYRNIFVDFSWDTPADMSWYGTGVMSAQEYYTLEVETHIKGYTKGIDIWLHELPNETRFDSYSLLPCPYIDTRVGDKFWDDLKNHATGSACARRIEAGQLYYTYVSLKPDNATPEDDEFIELRFQRGRWGSKSNSIIFPLDELFECRPQAKSADQTESGYPDAPTCIFSCHDHDSVSYSPIEAEDLTLPHFPDGAQLPICATWRFTDDTESGHSVTSCEELICDDDVDDDVDGLIDCSDPDCEDQCVPSGPNSCLTSAPTPWLPFPAGTSMGVTQRPGCGGHVGSMRYAYDFNVSGTYELDHDLVTVAASSGTVVDVVSHVQGSCWSPSVNCKQWAYNNGWGNCVVVKLDTCDDVYERYCHLDSGPGAIFVEEGDYVCHGSPLGRIGNTGYSQGPHLHWQRETKTRQSLRVDSFVEGAASQTCNWCNVSSNSNGCFHSENVACAGSNPCAGLASGDYCGSNTALEGYEGNNSDLVTCQGGIVAGVIHCTYGCQVNAAGVDDECYDSPPPSVCGDGIIEGDESCDSGDLGGANCVSEGYDGGQVVCGPDCQPDFSGCCSDVCIPGETSCAGGSEQICENMDGCYEWSAPVLCNFGCAGEACASPNCGNGAIDIQEDCDGNALGGHTCVSLGYDGGGLSCSQSCSFDTSSCCNLSHDIGNALSPDYTSDASGCSLGGGVMLKISAANISPQTIRFNVRKTDNGVWGEPATLRLYVGDGPTCGDPVNIVKAVVPVNVGVVTQTIDLTVNPYDAQWSNDETKYFWVGKSESGFESARASGQIGVTRSCSP